jgi:hypothetical protein
MSDGQVHARLIAAVDKHVASGRDTAAAREPAAPAGEADDCLYLSLPRENAYESYLAALPGRPCEAAHVELSQACR